MHIYSQDRASQVQCCVLENGNCSVPEWLGQTTFLQLATFRNFLPPPAHLEVWFNPSEAEHCRDCPCLPAAFLPLQQVFTCRSPSSRGTGQSGCIDVGLNCNPKAGISVFLTW